MIMEPSTITTPRTTIVFLFLFVALSFLFSLSSCTYPPSYLYHICDNTTLFTSNINYQSNLNILLSSLSSNSNKSFRFTVGQSPNLVYGQYYCRGDVTRNVCSDCVNTASREIVRRCPGSKVAFIWYDMCTFRYSDQFLSSTVTEDPVVYMWNTQNITDPTLFNQILGDTMNVAATEAAFNPERFATVEANFTQFQNIYSLVQCSPDLTMNDCNRCLVGNIASLPTCCSGKQGGRVLNPSCNVRFEVYPFYQIIATAPPPPPTPTTTNSPPPTNNRTTIPGELPN